MKFQTVTFSVCCHPEILVPWQRDVTTSLYSDECHANSSPGSSRFPMRAERTFLCHSPFSHRPQCTLFTLQHFKWDDCNNQEKLATKVLEKFGRETKCIMVFVKMVNFLRWRRRLGTRQNEFMPVSVSYVFIHFATSAQTPQQYGFNRWKSGFDNLMVWYH